MLLAEVIVNLILNYRPNLPDLFEFWNTPRTRNSQKLADGKPLFDSSVQAVLQYMVGSVGESPLSKHSTCFVVKLIYQPRTVYHNAQLSQSVSPPASPPALDLSLVTRTWHDPRALSGTARLPNRVPGESHVF